MSRRQFLERMLAVFGASAATPLARAAAHRRVELQRSPVAGFQYHQGEDVWSLLEIGAPLELRREPDNRHDPRAVRVDWNGRKLGYVPRVDNAAIAYLLAQGQRVEAEIGALRQSPNPWDRIEFSVFLCEYS